jgi:hypothetical protein
MRAHVGSGRGWGAVFCGALLGLGACRSKSEAAPASDAPPAEASAAKEAPPAEPAAPAAAEATEGVALTGTPQALTFTGAVTGTIKDASAGKGSLGGCTKTGTAFTIRLAGRVDGTKDAYAVDLSVLAYKKPGAYQVPDGLNLSSGASVQVVEFVKSKLTMGLVAASGTVTINADEKSGEVDVDLKGGFGAPERGHLKGSWKCPPNP